MSTSFPTVDTTASAESLTLDVVTIAEAAALLRCGPWPLFRLVREGRLPASRPVGNAGPWLIQRADLVGRLAAS